MTDPTNPAPPAEELRESTRRADFIAFMLGAGPFEGQWFSDPHPGRRGNFWWRTDFRELLLGHIAALEAEKSVLTVENERMREAFKAMRDPSFASIQAGCDVAWPGAECVYDDAFDSPEQQLLAGYRAIIDTHSRAALSSLPAMKGEG